MGKARDSMPALYTGNKILSSDIMGGGGIGIGNIYYVVHVTDAYYSQFAEDYNVQYSDGSFAVCPDAGDTTTFSKNTGIQDALNKCVANRNDYVVIMPSTTHYDIEAALTMSKRSVHLICPSGLGHEVGSSNAILIHQNTANTNCITLTGDGCEIAGIWFRTFTSTTASVIEVPSASVGQSSNIHHNTFTQQLSGATNGCAISFSTAGGGNYSNIHHNRFTVTGAGLTLTYCVYLATTQSVFANNDMHAMNGATIGIGVRCNGVGSVIKYNNFYAHPASAGIAASAFTSAIYVDASNDSTCVIGNRGAVVTGTLVEGGTADTMFCDNRSAVDGGLVPVDQNIDT
jgi:hypothetical protein